MHIRQIFLNQMEYRLQSMFNHMVGWAASVISPFYSTLLGRIIITHLIEDQFNRKKWFTFDFLVRMRKTKEKLYRDILYPNKCKCKYVKTENKEQCLFAEILLFIPIH